MTDPNEETRPIYEPRSLSQNPAPAPRPEPVPARSRTPWVVTVVLLAVIALALGGATAWAYTSGDSKTADLNAQLDSANSQLATATSQVSDLQAQLDKVNQNSSDQSGQIKKLNKTVKTLRKKVSNSIPMSTLPVVVYAGQAGPALKAEFQKQLVQPIADYAKTNQQGILVSIYIEIPAHNGAAFTYTAIYANEGYEAGLYGSRGSPLPAWQPICDSGCG